MGTGLNEVGGCFWVWDAILVKDALIAFLGFGGTTWHPVREGLVLGIVLQLFLQVCRPRMFCNFAIYLYREGQAYLRYSCCLLEPKFSRRGLSVDLCG
jgi:hypothetical protein